MVLCSLIDVWKHIASPLSDENVSVDSVVFIILNPWKLPTVLIGLDICPSSSPPLLTAKASCRRSISISSRYCCSWAWSRSWSSFLLLASLLNVPASSAELLWPLGDSVLTESSWEDHRHLFTPVLWGTAGPGFEHWALSDRNPGVWSVCGSNEENISVCCGPYAALLSHWCWSKMADFCSGGELSKPYDNGEQALGGLAAPVDGAIVCSMHTHTQNKNSSFKEKIEFRPLYVWSQICVILHTIRLY